MKIFDKENHLEKSIFQNLDTLSQTQLIEFNNHLCSCEKCMEAYTDYLQNSVSLDPPEETAFKAVKRVKEYEKRNRGTSIFKVCVSACFAFIILYSSVLPGIKSSLETRPENNKQQEVSVFTKINSKLKEGFTNLNFNYQEKLNSKGESDNEKK